MFLFCSHGVKWRRRPKPLRSSPEGSGSQARPLRRLQTVLTCEAGTKTISGAYSQFAGSGTMGLVESRRPVVLIVEDEFLLRMDAVDIIAAAGFEAIEASNADEAIEIL